MRARRLILTVVACAAVASALVYSFHLQRNNPAERNAVATTKPDRGDGTPRGKGGRKNTDQVDVQGIAPWTRLEPAYREYQVRVAPDGTLKIGAEPVRLYGITIPGRNQICKYRNGQPWACGQRAYIALLNFIGSTTIACRLRDMGRPDRLICHVVGIDVSEWMLRSGWAYLGKGVTDKAYVNAAATGPRLKIGLWAERP